ncbi:MAG: primosomal protein N', partial [Sphingomonadales bacterium]
MAKDLDFFENEDGRVSVLLPFGFGRVLDYRFSGKRPPLGSFVKVPLGARSVNGVVWQKPDGDKEFPLSKLKPIYEILKVPLMSSEQQKFVNWVADYTLSMPGNVLKMSMSVPGALKKLPTQTLYRKTSGALDPVRLTEKRMKALDQIIENKTYSTKEIARLGGVSEAVVRGMIKLGLLQGVERLRDRPYLPPDPNLPGPDLTIEQSEAVEALKTSLGKGFRPTALEGVTGSGKTEVYFEVIAEVLKNSEAQVLVLLPEIALTNQWLDRFEKRFGARPVEWHSDLGKAERRRAWRSVISGEARIVVGARSALFLPFGHLSLIIVDEEHDQSFKQEEGVPYHARDMAVMRANLAECPIILSSATLSYETLANIERERYARVTLKKRYGGATLPDIYAVDMREEKLPADRWISGKLVNELKATLARGEQGMLFLNRRGYAPLTLCRTCGTRIECPDCTAWLVEHRLKARLACHHCGYSVPKPKHCPECGDTESLAICGPGVERLEEEVATLFPSAKRLVMTSDTMTSPAKAAEMVAKIATGVADIIIGTQVITKGYHFPKLTLVGVIDADLGLKGGDLRAGERTYQQLEQVAGRAGREALKGHVYIQTYMPENPVMEALISGDKPRFIGEDMKQRRAYGMPPYGRLASVVISGREHRSVEEFSHVLARACPGRDGVRLFGPAQAYMARRKGQFRYRLLI